jgi:hypothetical protein
VTVGYSAFYPFPESFFEDPEAAGEQPVGNGPFQADEPFQPGVGITLTRYDEYAGEDKAEVSAVEYRVYTDVKTAYTDVVAGNLDVLRRIPARRVRRALPGGHLVLLHLPGASALRQALRRQAGPSGAVDGNRPRADRHCDLQRHPDSGHIGHRPR